MSAKSDSFEPNPKLEQAMDQAIAMLAQAVNKAKSDWLDTQMQRLMPPDLYALSKSDKGSHRFKLARWVSANKIEMKEYPVQNQNGDDKVRNLAKIDLMLGTQLVSRFSARLRGDKVESMFRDYPVITCS